MLTGEIQLAVKNDTGYMNDITNIVFNQYAKEDEPFSPDEIRTILDNIVDVVNKRNRLS